MSVLHFPARHNQVNQVKYSIYNLNFFLMIKGYSR